MSAIERGCNNETTFVATVEVKPRTLFSKHGRAWQVCGEDAIGVDEVVVGHDDVRTEITKANLADVFAEDADVFVNEAGTLAYLSLVAAGANAFKAGAAQVASGATDANVMTMLNF